MLKFIQNIGDYFSSNYFDEDFASKVLAKTGYATDDIKEFNKKITPLKERYFRFKQLFIEGKLRTKDKVFEAHQFHTEVLNTLEYDGENTNYKNLFHLSEQEVIPVRHILYRGDQPHLMIMEMQALLKEDDTDPDGLFEQRYNVETEEQTNPPQRYHRSQWDQVFKVPPDVKICPVVINKAISQLFLLEQHLRPKYILLLAGNIAFLLEQEKWFRGSYLQIDLEELFSEATANRNANYYALFYFLLAKETLAPESNMVLLDQLDEDSHKIAYEVTKDLKEGIIHAVEALANEALYYKKEKLHESFDETDDVFEQQVKDDCLKIIYRLLFIFYAESREDLDILPSDDITYQRGYSLEMLRDLEQVPLYSDNSLNGYFFHESLSKLFYVLSSGYREKENGDNKSFKVRHIDSPLFNNAALKQLATVKFRNKVWQDIICRLSLSKQQRGKSRGRISYSNLGINQLGSVYESLLAYRGFYAEQDYIEVHKANEPNEGTYLVPRSRRDDFEENEILKDDNEQAVIIKKGTFVYRLSGRDRQKSASYYTPEVLTQCTVKYTLKPILEKLDKGNMKATELLELKLLEPAMGAAAFHNEMINQLAEAYLNYRQEEYKKTGKIEWKVQPDKYKEELQKVKAFIATNNVYGVDLNPTAIELGKLSLWLNVIHKDMETPFFSNRLAVGNAVVGAWLKVYKEKDLLEEYEIVKDAKWKDKKVLIKKEWWETAPRQLEFKPTTEYVKIKHGRKQDEIYHFLLPDKNMVSSAGIKLPKEEYDKEAKAVIKWRKDWIAPLKKSETDQLKKICNTIDGLLVEYYRFQRTINLQTSNRQEVFGAAKHGEVRNMNLRTYDEKERLSDQRNRHNAPYFKLKMVMDYWCSLWFWDVRQAAELPTRQQYWQDIGSILELDAAKAMEGVVAKKGQQKLFETASQISMVMESDPDALLEEGAATAEFSEAVFEYANRKDLFDNNQRLRLVCDLARQYYFFHPQLEFLEVFWERGGFDLIAGNPPWIKIAFDKSSFLSDFEPLIVLRNLSSSDVEVELPAYLLKHPAIKPLLISEEIQYESFKYFFNSIANYTFNLGGKSNLFRLVLENCLKLSSENVGLVIDEGLFDDPNVGLFRKALYYRMLYHFRFNNELKLFSEVGNAKKYELLILGSDKPEISFLSICNLFHPLTIDICHTAADHKVYAIRDDNDNWELGGNSSRIIHITNESLKYLHPILEPDNSDSDTIKLPLVHNNLLLTTIIKTGQIAFRVKDIKDVFSTQMINETNGQNDGTIKRVGQYVALTEFIFSGPHYYVATPFNKTPNENCSSHRDYSEIDLTKMPANYLPRTVYKLLKTNSDFIPKSYYHIHRRRAMNTNERTLIGCIAPPGIPHTNSSLSIHFKDTLELLSFSFYSNSIVYDFLIRVTGNSDMWFSTVENLPFFKKPNKYILNRGLRLNCLSELYADLWNQCIQYLPVGDRLSKNTRSKIDLANLEKWSQTIPLRTDLERRQALLEIDVLVAMDLGLELQELISIYEIQFPVMKKYDSNYQFDENGNFLGQTEWLGLKLNRADDYKVAWEHFEKLFGKTTISNLT